MGAGGGRLWTTGASGTPYPASRALEQARKDPIRTYKKTNVHFQFIVVTNKKIFFLPNTSCCWWLCSKQC